MNILPQIQGFLQSHIFPLVPPKWWPMFTCGVNVLSLTPFLSLNSNARLVPKARKAAQNQMWRLTQHPLLSQVFSSLLTSLFRIDRHSVVAIDISSFGQFQVLMLALQTREGRAIPVWFDILEYPVVNEGSQNQWIIATLTHFLSVVGCTPKLVADRGFIGPTLIRGFLDLGIPFYVRMKAGKQLWMGKRMVRLANLHTLDAAGIMYGQALRVVRSSKTLMHQRRAKECWYVLTNDTSATREHILNYYYYRFEIEETFKDLKHLFTTKPRWFTKQQTMRTLLWFQILGIWIAWKVHTLFWGNLPPQPAHPKQKFSWFKTVWESIQQARLVLLIPMVSKREVSWL